MSTLKKKCKVENFGNPVLGGFDYVAGIKLTQIRLELGIKITHIITGVTTQATVIIKW